jgi:hypothetical protein
MALNKGKIISDVLLMLGNTRDYNESQSQEYQIAERLYANIIEEFMYNKRLLFNSATVELNYAETNDRNRFGDYKYKLPVGVINIIGPDDIRMEGEYIYSKTKDAVCTYCKLIPENEIPEYMTLLIKYTLATQMAVTYPQYAMKLEMFAATRKSLYDEIVKSEISNIDGTDGLVRRYR